MIHSVIKPLELDRSWQDGFGTILACLEFGSRKRKVLVLTSSELGQVMLEALAGVAFQGRIVLAILEHLHRAPLEAVMRDQEPNFVISLEQAATGLATHGSAIHGESSLEIASTGLEYVELGTYPAWKNINAFESNSHASSVTGSVASSLGHACLVCNPSDLKTALETAFKK
jgi:hypothetical protein